MDAQNETLQYIDFCFTFERSAGLSPASPLI